MVNLEHFFLQEKNSLIIYAQSITRNGQEAQDVVQEVFLECLEKNVVLTKPYLFRAVKNRGLNRVRNHNRMIQFMDKLKLLFNFLAVEPSNENETRLEQALHSLSPKLKEVLHLRIKSELKIAEIALILDVPTGTVKSRINLALKKIKIFLGETNE